VLLRVKSLGAKGATKPLRAKAGELKPKVALAMAVRARGEDKRAEKREPFIGDKLSKSSIGQIENTDSFYFSPGL
jgi:hypothetical protein